MKLLGLLGGMSWESTQTYYQLLNRGVAERLGGLHSARCLLYSVDFAEIEALQSQGAWQQATILLAEAAIALETAGAEGLVICTNTMHKLADAIACRITIPLLHIVDATGQAIRERQLQTVGLLGTRFTMQEAFYRQRLEEGYHLQVLTPPAAEQIEVDRIIYDELCRGRIRENSRRIYRQTITALVEQGAQGIILGCTEIGLLVSTQDSPVPVFDTTALHATMAIDFSLS
ncbi:MAG TPA: aspartate/glutamate racemase family protein [Gammaproteobacteria bacterium]|mgnify:CR=1 FL=1|nr:aspartate/glutamate racemase family protein [Gammaproteobacteria bacterium]